MKQGNNCCFTDCVNKKTTFHLMSQEQTCLVSNIVWNDGALGTAIHTCEPICFTLGMILHMTTLYRRGVLSDHFWSHRQQQVILMRLPTDHNQLNAHLNYKFKRTRQWTTSYRDDPPPPQTPPPPSLFCKRSVRRCSQLQLSLRQSSMAASKRWTNTQHSLPDVDCPYS